MIFNISPFFFVYCVVQDIISEHPERFFVGEIVREKIFMQYRKEVPYACQVSCSLVPAMSSTA
jgi:GTPase Era involved in 16S rRNA processing